MVGFDHLLRLFNALVLGPADFDRNLNDLSGLGEFNRNLEHLRSSNQLQGNLNNIRDLDEDLSNDLNFFDHFYFLDDLYLSDDFLRNLYFYLSCYQPLDYFIYFNLFEDLSFY